MGGDSGLEITGFAEVERHVRAVLKLFHKHVVSADGLNSGRRRIDQVPVAVSHAGLTRKIDCEFHSFRPLWKV